MTMTGNRSVTASFTAWYFATGQATAANPSGTSVYGTYGPFGSDYSFQPYTGFPGDIFVLPCDFNSDGRQDLITGAGPGGGPHLKVFSALAGGGTPTHMLVDSMVAACVAGGYCYTGGVRPHSCLGNNVVRVQFGHGGYQDILCPPGEPCIW